MTLPELLLALVPLAIGAALQPPQVVALIVLLQTPRGVANVRKQGAPTRE